MSSRLRASSLAPLTASPQKLAVFLERYIAAERVAARVAAIALASGVTEEQLRNFRFADE